MRRAPLLSAVGFALLSAGLGGGAAAAQSGRGWLFNDAHFHLTNYIQRGLTIDQYVAMMGSTIKRSTLFGIPLQQTWSYPNSGDFAPTYYLQTDAPLYYYSFTDAMIATSYLSLPTADRARLDPMITGFNPADMYAADHIRRVLEIFPGVFTGIGEFSIHKEFVSGKVAGETASLTNPALDRILDFAGEVGLVVIIHCDIDMPFTRRADPQFIKRAELPIYYAQMRDLLVRHPKTTIIWAHTGLGRVVQPAPVQATATSADARPPTHIELIDRLLADPQLSHVYFDISWDEVAKYAISSPETIERVSAAFDRHPDRFLFGTDNVAPPDLATDLRVYEMWEPIFSRIRPATKTAITLGNYERLFDAARLKVRAWEGANVKH